jgi:hypothetical protein
MLSLNLKAFNIMIAAAGAVKAKEMKCIIVLFVFRVHYLDLQTRASTTGHCYKGSNSDRQLRNISDIDVTIEETVCFNEAQMFYRPTVLSLEYLFGLYVHFCIQAGRKGGGQNGCTPQALA